MRLGRFLQRACLLAALAAASSMAQEQPAGQPEIRCGGEYPHHLQGVCADTEFLYWSFTTRLVKTDLRGRVLASAAVANHHGDLCWRQGKLYVAVNLGEFNNPQGKADCWIYVYDAATLRETARHPVQEVFHGAGGVGVRDNRFFVVGGLPDGVAENYVYEYDAAFRFVKRHVIASGHTHLGIQTAAFAEGRWWFGCYGEPRILLVTEPDFSNPRRYEFDCSLGVEAWSEGRLLAATGRCQADRGCTGAVRIAVPDPQHGLRLVDAEGRPE